MAARRGRSGGAEKAGGPAGRAREGAAAAGARAPAGDPSGAIFFWLQQAHQAMRREILARFQAHGEPLTPEQWTILLALWTRDGRSQAELAHATGRDRPGVTRLVDTLERRRLVARRPSPDDRRRHRVVLTTKGRRLHDLLLPVVGAVMTGALAGIPPRDREAVRRILRRIRQNLSRGGGAREGPGDGPGDRSKR